MISYIYLLFFLKNLVFVLAQNDADIAAVHLLWQGDCTSDQKVKIKAGWDDAMTIVDNMKGSIDFNNGAAELEFLGPKQYINSYTNNIVALFNQAATWKLGWWSAWYVYANCEDWKNSCKRNTLAYTNNVDYKTGLIEKPNDPSSTVKITFCPDYFEKARLSKVIKNGKARSIGNSDKWNLFKYANKGSVVLHELMHGDAVAYAANGDRHVTDMQIQMRPLDGPADWRWTKIYGLLFTRVLARLDDKQLGSYVTRNDLQVKNKLTEISVAQDMVIGINVFLITLGISLAFLLAILRIWISWRRLGHIPGPYPACITDFQRMLWVKTKRAHLILQDLHEKHGEVVRIGPNNVTFSNPEAITTVYTTRTGFPKSKFYVTLQPYTPKGGSLHAIFNTPDENIHKQLKTPIANFFTANNVLSYEASVYEVLAVLQEKLDSKYVGNDQVFELSSWMQFFAFDVMGTLTFSHRYGFLDTGRDVGRMLGNIKDFMRAAAPWTQIPQLDAILRKTRVGDWMQRHFFTATSMGILGFVGKAINEKRVALLSKKHTNQQEGVAKDDNNDPKGSRRDFLTRYLEIQESNPETIPDWAPTAWTFSKVIAGSDSVGSLMCTTMFNILVYPYTIQKLQAELDTSNASHPFPKYSEVRNLPYLNACVLEGIRMHPPFCLPLERVVPKGGIAVLGHFLPEGTVVGASPYVVNRHKETFGDDAEFWRPERWLERGEEHKKKLEATLLTFGSGRRICLGRYLGTLEITKLISFLVLNYDIYIVDPERFKVENSWFFFQEGLYARIEKRLKVISRDTT